MKLIFSDPQSIAYRDKMSNYLRKRERRFKNSGLSREQFEAKEELAYWMNPSIAPIDR